MRSRRLTYLLTALVVLSATTLAHSASLFELREKVHAWDSSAEAWFGGALDIDSSYLAVGAGLARPDGIHASGAVYVFRRNGRSWVPAVKLTPPILHHYASFGTSLDLAGSLLAVGAPYEDSYLGAVYLYRRQGNRWSLAAKISAPTPSWTSYFGYSVGLEGGVLVISAPWDDEAAFNAGAVYVYDVHNPSQPALLSKIGASTSWSYAQKLLASDGAAYAEFGYPVRIDGNRMAVGARFADGASPQTGAAYIFEKNAGGTWTEAAKVQPTDGSYLQWFGSALGLSGNSLAVGSWQDDDQGLVSGSAYVFERDRLGHWLQTQKILAKDGFEGQWFGLSLALSRNTLVIGARDNEVGPNSGSVYSFED
jgi:hypothetical protein